jgi:F420-dependent oxidoreductase-like protein
MRLRVLLEPHHGATYAQIRDLAQAAEEGGFDAFFRSDHYLGIDANDTTYQPTDSWTTLAGLALQTERVRIGTLVNASTFRLPGQLAVEVATVDQMSGGRAELGIGAAWYEREHQYFGIPFPPLGERFDRLEEQLAILTGIWDTRPGERFSFDGKHFQVQDCASIPRWASRPKIIIGGAGAKRTPTLAARYADEFNGALGLEVRERYANFRRICEDVVGRDPAEVRLSATLPVCIGSDAADLERRKESLGEPGARLLAAGVTGTAGDVIRAIEDLAGQGADTVYFHLYGPRDVEHVRLLGSEVVSRFLPAGPPASCAPAQQLPREACWREYLPASVLSGRCVAAQRPRREACRCGQMPPGIRSGSMRIVEESKRPRRRLRVSTGAIYNFSAINAGGAIYVQFRRHGN